MFTAIDTNALSNVTGGAGNTGITGGLTGINNQVPPTGGFNTGITGGLTGINNQVPVPGSQAAEMLKHGGSVQGGIFRGGSDLNAPGIAVSRVPGAIAF